MQPAKFFSPVNPPAARALRRAKFEGIANQASSQSQGEIPASRSLRHVFLSVLICAASLPVLSQEVQRKDASKVASISAVEHDFFFILRSCRRSGSTVRCTGSVSNKDQKQQRVFGIMKEYTNFVDNLGDKHPLKKSSVGMSSYEQELQPDLLTDFSLESEGLNPAVKRVTVVLGYVLRARPGVGGMPYRVVFKDVPLSSD